MGLNMCPTYVIVYGTHVWDTHIMPFSNKYPNLGETVRMRIPHAISSHITMLLDEYERIADKHGTIYLNTIMDRIENGV